MDVQRVQFPLRLCFAVTVHRSQGQTLDRGRFLLPLGCFHECVNVCLFRVQNSAEIRILTTEGRICPYTLRAKAVKVI